MKRMTSANRFGAKALLFLAIGLLLFAIHGRAGYVFVAMIATAASSGDLDPSFDSDGLVTTDFGGQEDGITGIALQSDGKIVAVGSSDGKVFALARYNTDGSLDTSFDSDGLVTTGFWATCRSG